MTCSPVAASPCQTKPGDPPGFMAGGIPERILVPCPFREMATASPRSWAMFTTRAAFRRYRLGSGLLTALTWCGILGCGAPEYRSKPFPVEGVVKWEKGPMVTELEGGSVEFEK